MEAQEVTLTSLEQMDEVPAGRRQHFVIPVAARASGETLGVRVTVQRGTEPGPTLALIAGVHGDAPSGTLLANALLREVGSAFRGTIVSVPVANPLAFESGTRTTGGGWNTDKNNLNRVFPGRRNGAVNEMLAHAISAFVIDRADAVVDFHCSHTTSIDYTLVCGDQTPVQREAKGLAQLLGTRFVFVHEVDPFTGTIDQYARDRGVVPIIFEQGGACAPDSLWERSMIGLRNVLIGLGMVDGTVRLPDRQLLMRERTIVYHQDAGIFVPTLPVDSLATVVDGGTVLGKVVDPYGRRPDSTIIAPYDSTAILSMRSQMSRVNPGDSAFILGNATTGVWVTPTPEWRTA